MDIVCLSVDQSSSLCGETLFCDDPILCRNPGSCLGSRGVMEWILVVNFVVRSYHQRIPTKVLLLAKLLFYFNVKYYDFVEDYVQKRCTMTMPFLCQKDLDDKRKNCKTQKSTTYSISIPCHIF